MEDELKQRVIEKLQHGEDLPAEWARFLFPPEKREYELVYHGKEREEDILANTLAVPLQAVRTFGKNGGNGWQNMLIFGDNLQVMKSLLELKKAGKLCNADGIVGVKLIYIDPPFGTGDIYNAKGDALAYSAKLQGVKYIEFVRRRLVFLRELLSDDGSIYIRIDYHFGHYIKAIMDEVFGNENFRNEIIVKRGQAKAGFFKQFDKINSVAVAYDTLFWYSKRSDTRFTKIKKEAPVEDQANGKWMNLIKAKAYDRPTMKYEILGVKKDASWMWSKERSFRAVDNFKKYLEVNDRSKETLEEYWERTGEEYEFVRRHGNQIQYWIPPRPTVLVDNNWLDIKGYDHTTNYPTENSEELLERVLQITDRGDLIIDCFAGSGTTLAVAEKLGRRWIGVDCGKLAIYTMQKRLLNIAESKNLENPKRKYGKPCKPFTLYNAGLYDFSKLKELPWESWRFFALQLFQCRGEPHKIGGIALDGYLKGASVLVFNHLKNPGARFSEETLQDIHEALGTRVSSKLFIIAPALTFDFQQDYIDLDGVRYYALRIPYSIVNELHQREFTALKQPSDEMAVNDTVEAVGFDFIRTPELKFECGAGKRKGELIEEGFIRIKTFKSEAVVREPLRKKGNLETLSMVMLDYDFDEKSQVFDLDAVFYADAVQKEDWTVRFPLENLGQKMMAVFIDIYGNEARVVIDDTDFERKPKTGKKATAKNTAVRRGKKAVKA